MPFDDRRDAGCKLAAVLAKYKDRQPVVLALPRGGVPVAAEVAVALNAPLDLILVRKIGVPFQPELAMGAVIDDGIATGATTRAALRATRMRNPKTLVLAVPVAPTENLAAMREEADDVVCLEDYAPFGAIGYYYSDFRQISDQEVTDILARFPARAAREARQSAA